MIDNIKRLFVLDKKRVFIGCLLATIASVSCFVWFSWRAGILFGFLFVLCGLIKFNNNIEQDYFIDVWCVLAIVGTCFCSQLICEAGLFGHLSAQNILLEILCVSIVCLFVYIIVLNIRTSITIGTIIMILLSVVNYYVVAFKGNEFTPMDISSMVTAANVAMEYRYTIGPTLMYGLMIYVLLLFSGGSLNWEANIRKSIRKRIVASLIEGVLIFVWYVGCSQVDISTWGQNGSSLKGYFVNFSAQLIEGIKDKKPEHYSIQLIGSVEKEYLNNKDSVDVTIKSPNVIVIMNESFADFRILGPNFITNVSVMPFYDSLKENTIKGYALASVYGGGTANSEYEVLTGNSMGFITAGATVYQLYLKSSSYSMASYFNALGYTCMATHPYKASGWSRTRAWPYLGFETISFIEDYPQQHFIRDYVSDREMYEYIIRQFEDKEDSEKIFLFGITMQNHGGYNYEGYNSPISLQGLSKKYPDVEQYVGLVHESDAALEYLINYFEKAEEDTVILFFGDHMPRVEQSFYDEVHGGTYNSLQEQQLQYTVPFFVWANYDIEEKYVELTSLNYLSNYVYEAAGVELPAYNQFLKKVAEYVPAMNSMGFYSKGRGVFLEYDEAAGTETEALKIYEALQYNSLFDSDNRSEVFFNVD